MGHETMAKVGATEAEKLTGVNRSTIHRAMKSGKLSYETDKNGHKKIDVSELDRVFGLQQQNATPRNVAQRGNDTARNDAELLQAQLKAEQDKNKLMQDRISDKDARIEELNNDRDHWRGQAEAVTRLLTDQRNKSSEAEEREKAAQTKAEQLKAELEAEKGRGWWSRLLGR